MNSDDQRRLVLTPHPLQRVGAHALARLGSASRPEETSPESFDAAAGRMTDDAIRAALTRDTKKPTGSGFWLKCSLSLFPNAPMNHPANVKKDDEAIRQAVARWRRMPAPAGWPGVPCVLCGRAAVRFFGKLDVPLAESDSYRNTTPRGHDGMALCWPCASSFHALPYGCQLTGGPAVALHSWDERFLLRTIAEQVSDNLRFIEIGRDASRHPASREVVALRALRWYEDRLSAGVELLVFSNNNRGQSLEIYSMDQPLAEWLRRSSRDPDRRSGFSALVRAHRTANVLGVVALARNAFYEPARIVRACAAYLAGPAAEHGLIRPDTTDLAELSFSYVNEVMSMDETDLTEIKATAGRVAAVLSRAETGGKLLEFYSQAKDQKRLRGWLQRRAVYWTLEPPDGESGPLLTTRGFELLFDPDSDSLAWFHRQLLLIAVLEDLQRRGWRPADAKDAVERFGDVANDLPEDEAVQLDDRKEEQ